VRRSAKPWRMMRALRSASFSTTPLMRSRMPSFTFWMFS